MLPLTHMNGDPSNRVIGIDISGAFGTGIRGALVDGAATVLATKEVITPRGGADELVATLATMAGRLAESAKRDGKAPAAVGVACPGVVDETTGVVHRSSNLGLTEVRLAQLLRDRVGLPTFLMHDSSAGALAESLVGVGRGVSDLLLMVVGNGVGAAAISDGRVIRGAHGSAGELGHISVDANGLPCSCGGRGCVETFASEPSLAKRYTMAAKEAISADEVIARAMRGHPAAARVWNDALSALALVLSSAVAMIDCELIVFSGTLTIPTAAVAPLRSLLAKRMNFVTPPRIEAGALGGNAGVLGAAAIAFENGGLADVVHSWRDSPLHAVRGAA